jgi:hypothetical protein
MHLLDRYYYIYIAQNAYVQPGARCFYAREKNAACMEDTENAPSVYLLKSISILSKWVENMTCGNE